MKAKYWMILMAFIIIFSVIGIVIIENYKGSPLTAEVYKDGELIRTVPLPTNEDIQIPVKGENEQENIVLISGNTAKMLSASCPDGLCVKQGEIQNSSVPIVCLPNRVVIRLNGGTATDAVTR